MEREKKLVNGVRVPYEKTTEELRIILSEGMTQFLPACLALSGKGTKESLEILREQLFSSDWCKRRATVEAIAYHPQGSCLSNDLMKMLSDKSNYVVDSVCTTLSRLKIYEAHDKIIELLKSKDDRIRKAAVSCLAEIYLDTDINILVEMYLTDKSKEVKDEAAWSLMKICHSTNWKEVYKILRTGFFPRHRLWACELIEKYGDESYIEDLKVMLGDKDGHVKNKANKVLQDFDFDCK